MADIHTPHPLPSIPEFLAAMNVRQIPVGPDSPDAPHVQLQAPDGWEQLDSDAFPGTREVWLRTGSGDPTWTDNVVVLVSRLSHPTDTAAILRCAPTECRRMPDWQEISVDSTPDNEFPSVAVTGTYAGADMSFWAYNRFAVINTERDQHLIQTTITIRTDTGTTPRDGETISAGLKIKTKDPESYPSQEYSGTPRLGLSVSDTDAYLETPTPHRDRTTPSTSKWSGE
ncbi:MAG: LpqN/LpqT family lipoprotein [Nocardia sp.]|nr:LpqN/LpqT family lipoprotein [Nocardia sp.]